jgi:uncharacterized protein YjbJ (UPF0337 family)
MQRIDTIRKYNSTFTIKGNWTARASQLKKQFPELTDADLLFERGRENELVARIEARLSKNREEVISIIKKVRVERI